MDNLNLISNFAEFKELKNIDKSTMIGVLEDVFRHALQKQYGTDENFDIIINDDKGDLEIWRNREVVADEDFEDEWDEDEDYEEGFDFGDEESTIYEVECACGEIINFDEDVLEAGGMICPNCGEKFECIVEEDDLKALDGVETEE